MDITSTPNRVRQCSRCLDDTEYFCVSCQSDLCLSCKQNHLHDLVTMDHNVVLYHEKLDFIQKEGKICEMAACSRCTEHVAPINLPFKNTPKQENQIKIMDFIKSKVILHRLVLRDKIKADIETCHKTFSNHRSDMMKKAQNLKLYCDKVFRCKHRCLRQLRKLTGYIASLQKSEHIYDQSAKCPIQFLKLPKMHNPRLRHHTSHLSMIESIIKRDVIESLNDIIIKSKGNRRQENACRLKLTSVPELQQSLVFTSDHIKCVANSQHYLKHLRTDLFHGSHTVTSRNELISIDRNHNISKYSGDMKNSCLMLRSKEFDWKPTAVYWSRITGDLLVGMHSRKSYPTGKIIRYHGGVQPVNTIPRSQREHLFSYPTHITENNKCDIMVSDYSSELWSGTVLSTDCWGLRRFSYKGHPPGTKLLPQGICVDTLSNIILCDEWTNSVQIIGCCGQFLSFLLIRPSGIFTPYSLSYDDNTKRLWVGSLNNTKVCVYRYVQQDCKNGHDGGDEKETFKKIEKKEAVKLQGEHGSLLKLTSVPELHQSFTVNDVDGCYHISVVTPEKVLVSDSKRNFIFTNAKGNTLHDIVNSDLNVYGSYGLHTVNTEGESKNIFYVHGDNNIRKVSTDSEITTFIVKTDSTWKIQCVHWSSFAQDLLVGLFRSDIKIGKVTRYSQSAELTETIEHDQSGLELFNCPLFITENNNGDVLVSDNMSAVVVTDNKGRHRFSYTGHPFRVEPCGICTDVLSNILVCDCRGNTVILLNEDGQFLSQILIKSEILRPRSLSYDDNTDLLWVGSWDTNKVCVYKYIQKSLTDEPAYCPIDENALCSS